MEVIAQLRELPLVWSVSVGKVADFCSFCLKRVTNLSRCSRCSFLRYCSTTCQKNDWGHHKSECRRIRAVQDSSTNGVNSEALEDDVRLIFRLLELMKVPQAVVKETDGRKLSDLLSHADKIEANLESSEEFRNFYLHKFAPFYSASNDNKTVPPPKVVLNAYGLVKINCFQVTNEELHAIGLGLYVSLCRLDHSCQPNGRIIFHGKEARVVPVELSGWNSSEVEEVDGHQVVHFDRIQHSYIDNLEPLGKRREILQRDYFFHCECRGCQDVERNAMMTSLFCAETLGCRGCMKSTAAGDDPFDVNNYVCSDCGKKISEVETAKMVLGTVTAGLRNLERSVRLSSHPQVANDLAAKLLCLTEGVMSRWNVDKMKITRNAYELSVHLQQWDNAVKLGSEVLQIYRYYLAAADPKLVTFVKKLAVCCSNAKDLGKAKELIKPYRELIGQLWGTDSDMFKQVEFMLNRQE